MTDWNERAYGWPAPRVKPVCAAFHNSSLDNFGVVIARNGVQQIRCVCGSCGWVDTHSWPHIRFSAEERAEFPIIRDNRTKETARCEVCNAPEVELHHFAPTHLFGYEEANEWPTAYLCPYHHQRWHKIVTPNMHRRPT